MFNYLCTECRKGTVREKRKPYEVNFRGVKFPVHDALLGVCDYCGAENFDGSEYQRWEKLFEKELTRRQKPLSAAEIKALRESLGLSQRQFADLIGCSRQSIYNWENPKRKKRQERQADLMMRLLAEPAALEFLLDRAQEIGVTLPRPSMPAGAASANGPVRVRHVKRRVPVTA